MNIYGVPTNLVVKWILEREDIKSWLDVACGTGRFLELVGYEPKEGLGIDICPTLQLPKGFKFEQADITKWTTDKRYDLVSMFQLVEHLEKDTSVGLINRYAKMERDGGGVRSLSGRPLGSCEKTT